MARISKKELKSLTDRYIYYLENEDKFPELFQGMKIVLMELKLIDTIDLEVFKRKHKKGLQQIEILENMFKKYKKDFRVKLLDDYLLDYNYLGFTEDDARALKGCINYIYNYCM